MLIELFGENFGCFRDEFRLSLVAGDVDPDSDRGVVEVEVKGDREPLRLLRAAAIYGPNASGKSTVLRAARALHGLIARSAMFRSDDGVPYHSPFAGAERAPSRLGVKAVVDGVVYDYECRFDERRVVAEQLDRHGVDGVATLFVREMQGVKGDWLADEQFRLVVEDFRENALLISLTDTLLPKLTGSLVPALRRLLRFVDGSAPPYMGYESETAARLAETTPDFRSWLGEQLRAADVGVTDFSVRKVRSVRQAQRTLFEDVSGDAGDDGERERVRRRLSLEHPGPEGIFTVPYEDESFGTRKLVRLAPLLYRLFSEDGAGATFVDEIGASLHPTLLAALVERVNCGTRAATSQGQLIFATHETSLIDGEARDAVLRLDQVYFTEKGGDGVGRLYSLSDFRERQNTNLRKRYLEGRYGAIPALGRFPLPT